MGKGPNHGRGRVHQGLRVQAYVPFLPCSYLPSYESDLRTDFRDKGLDNESLDPSHAKAGPALRKPEDPSKQDSRYPAPAVADVGNICLQQFPPPLDPVDITHPKSILRTGAAVVTGLCAVIWFFVGFGHSVSWKAFFVRSTLLGAMAAASWVGAENAGRKIEKELERVRMKMHTQRGEEHSPPTPESVEWMNALLKLVWGLINPDMFIPVVDVSTKCLGIFSWPLMHTMDADGRRHPASVPPPAS